jgi:hypothetical protein
MAYTALAAALLGVPRAEVGAAVREHTAKDAVTSIVAAWDAATPDEHMAAVEGIGVAQVWGALAAVVA